MLHLHLYFGSLYIRLNKKNSYEALSNFFSKNKLQNINSNGDSPFSFGSSDNSSVTINAEDSITKGMVQLSSDDEGTNFDLKLNSTSFTENNLICFPSMQVKFDDNFTFDCFVISATSPDNFFLVNQTQQVAFEVIHESLTTCYENNTTKPIMNFEFIRESPDKLVGALVAVKWHEDGKWYRGRVLEMNCMKARVIFIDFGNEDYITFDNLFPLHEQCRNHPAFAIKCHLDFNHDWKKLIDENTFVNLLGFGDHHDENYQIRAKAQIIECYASSKFTFDYKVKLFLDQLPPVDVSIEFENILQKAKKDKVN